MPGFETGSPGFLALGLWILPGTTYTLLPKSNQLYLIARLRQDRMRLGRMLGRTLGLVIAAKLFA